MASSSILRHAAQQNVRRSLQLSAASIGRRHIGQKYLAKVKQAEEQWAEKAQRIHKGEEKGMLDILEERGFVHQIVGERDFVRNTLINKRVGAYVGVDPTASSLHVGHLLPLMSLFWMYVHGFHTVTLLGGATAKIGDPTGRLTSRAKEHSAIRAANMVNMHYQMKRLWVNVEMYGRKFGYNWEWAWHRELVNNNAWINKLPILEFLQLMGPAARLGTMLARDTVKNKMEKGDGMSFAEFTYPLLQAWDWWHMYNTKGVQMQIGGADQMGNIIAGQDAVKHISAHHPDPDVRKGKDEPSAQPFGFTVPLLTTATGEKFGKSAGNAVWLDKELTSTFELYQFWMRQADADMPRYLRYFTFLPIEQIDKIVEEHNLAPHERKAQHVLARNFVELVHGEEEAKAAEVNHRLLFGKKTLASLLEATPAIPKPTGLNAIEPEKPKGPAPVTLSNVPQVKITLPRSVLAKSIGKIVYAAGLATSSSEGHRAVSNGSLYIGGTPGQKKAMDDSELKFTPVKNWIIADTSKYLVGDDILILRRGKHNIRIVKFVGDAEWQASGATYPGEDSAGAPARQVEDDAAPKDKKDKKKKKSLWSEFAPPAAEPEEPSVVRKIGGLNKPGSRSISEMTGWPTPEKKKAE